MSDNGKDIFKNFILAGVGALTLTAEKISESIYELRKIGKLSVEQGKDIVDELVKKGSLTVEQGKSIIENLKTEKEVNISITENIDLESLDNEKLTQLKEQIEKIENERKSKE